MYILNRVEKDICIFEKLEDNSVIEKKINEIVEVFESGVYDFIDGNFFYNEKESIIRKEKLQEKYNLLRRKGQYGK